MNRCSTRFRICPQQIAGIVLIIILLAVSCQNSRSDQDGSTSTAPAAQSDSPTVQASTSEPATPPPTETANEPSKIAAADPLLGPDGHYTEIQVTADGTKHLIPLTEVRSGGPPKDGIPSIDAPVFVGPAGWDALGYRGEELVIGVEVNDERRAYPFQVLVWHELVNDTFEGMPLLISYCPLCGTGIVFQRVIDEEPVEFGVSGELYNSDLLMYDRKTDTLWSQITGTAVIGELTGSRLEFYPSEIMTWDDWRKTYPDSEVLSRETGHSRNYDTDPYGDYYTDGSIWFPVGETDERLPAKERITGIEIDAETFGAYPDKAVIDHGPINDVLGSVPILVAADTGSGNNVVVFDRRVNGQELTFEAVEDGLIDVETGTRWSYRGEAVDGELAGAQLGEFVAVKGFWFAWYAFHPETELWMPS